MALRRCLFQEGDELLIALGKAREPLPLLYVAAYSN